MNFDAIQQITSAHLQLAQGIYGAHKGPLVVEINGNSGYACDGYEKVNQHTADLLCELAGFSFGAESWENKCEY